MQKKFGKNTKKESMDDLSSDFREYLINSLKDPQEALGYLEVALEEYEKDNNLEAFLLSIRSVAEAQGGLLKLARNTKLNRQNLYKVLSAQGNPKVDTLSTILKGIGFKLSIAPIQESKKTS